MTECPVCWKAEASRRDRLARWILDQLDRPSPAQQMLAAYGRSMRLMLGGIEPTWYERHRAAWEKTGDQAELNRMLRHV